MLDIRLICGSKDLFDTLLGKFGKDKRKNYNF